MRAVRSRGQVCTCTGPRKNGGIKDAAYNHEFDCMGDLCVCVPTADSKEPFPKKKFLLQFNQKIGKKDECASCSVVNQHKACGVSGKLQT